MRDTRERVAVTSPITARTRLDRLGRHVCVRPSRASEPTSRRVGRLGRRGDPEVAHVAVRAPAGLRDKDVRGLDVAMDEAQGVGVVERLRQPGRRRSRQAAAPGSPLTEHRAQVGLDEQHGDVEDAAILAGRVDGHDVRVPLEHRQGTGLGDEAPAVASSSGKLAREHLDRDAPAEAVLLLGLEHRSEGTTPDQLDQAKAADLVPGTRCGAHQPGAAAPATVLVGWLRPALFFAATE